MGSNSAGSYIDESLPNITGEFSATRAAGNDITSGAFTQSEYLISSVAGTGKYGRTYNFNASRSSSTYQNGAKVRPDSMSCLYIIKY